MPSLKIENVKNPSKRVGRGKNFELKNYRIPVSISYYKEYEFFLE